MSTTARTDSVIATSRAYIRGGRAMYLLFVPARRLRNVTVFMAIVAFLQIRPQGLFALKTRSLL